MKNRFKFTMEAYHLVQPVGQVANLRAIANRAGRASELSPAQPAQ